MRSLKSLAILWFTVLVAGTCFAQSKDHNPSAPVARLSYRSTYGVDWREQDGYPRICFALYGSGDYRLTRMTKNGAETLHGTLSQGQIAKVSGALDKLDSKNRAGGIILQGSESLVAEVVRGGKTMHYAWVDPDHLHPFPDSALNLVNWLQGFKAQGAAPLTLRELSDEPICPPASEKPLQPTVAGLSGASDAAGCEGRVR